MKELEEIKCPICHKKGNISIKSFLVTYEERRIEFYAKCNQCGYESFYFDRSQKVIDYLLESDKNK